MFLLQKYSLTEKNNEYYLERAGIFNLNNLLYTNNKKADCHCRNNVLKIGKKTIRICKKVAYNNVETYRYMGIYYWIIKKKKVSLRYWTKSITEGERMRAMPELARTYFEVGKRLLEKSSDHREMNGLMAENYIDKAKSIFEEFDLQWDLDKLNDSIFGVKH